MRDQHCKQNGWNYSFRAISQCTLHVLTALAGAPPSSHSPSTCRLSQQVLLIACRFERRCASFTFYVSPLMNWRFVSCVQDGCFISVLLMVWENNPVHISNNTKTSQIMLLRQWFRPGVRKNMIMTDHSDIATPHDCWSSATTHGARMKDGGNGVSWQGMPSELEDFRRDNKRELTEIREELIRTNKKW